MDMLKDWLAGLDADQLEQLLRYRRDLTVPPPGTLAELAWRMSLPASAGSALTALPAPAIQLAEVIASLGEDCDRAAVAETVGHTAGDTDITVTLGILTEQGLVLTVDDRLRLAPGANIWRRPFRLGPPAAELLQGCAATELHRMADAIGAGRGRYKAESIRAIVGWLSDRINVRRLVDSAPAPVAAALTELAHHGPTAVAPAGMFDWAAGHGLVVLPKASWFSEVVMPREVAVALREPNWRPAFEPQYPTLPTTAVSADAVEQASAAAALDAVRRFSAVLDCCTAKPVSIRKSGGVGIRELRRLAKETGESVEQLVFWLNLAQYAELLEDTERGVRAGAAAAAWRRQEPADALVTLLDAWQTLPDAPLLASEEVGGPAALWWSDAGELVPQLRLAAIASLVTLPVGSRVEPADLAVAVRWRAPLLADSIDDLDGLVSALYQEAEMLGLVALGAPGELVRALSDPPHLIDTARRILPGAVTLARFQADLTAVVPGPPSGELAALLDALADRESSGTASTWRFSPDSVRAALDTGKSEQAITEQLTAVAVDGELPQPLRYLIADVARRHGRVRGRAVACCLRSDDTALLAEIRATRSLRQLGLSELAPTVLASSAPLEETLAELRAAGFAPIGEDATGVPLLSRPDSVDRVPPQRRGGTEGTELQQVEADDAGPVPVDPAQLARKLLAVGPDAVPEASDELDVIRIDTPQLSPAEQHLLAARLGTGESVRIDYVNAQGSLSSRIIEDLELIDSTVSAFCTLRQDDRHFRLDRIRAVSPS